MNKETSETLLVISMIIAIASLPLSWLTHLVVCFLNEQWGFLIAGAIFFPVAIVHGYGVWLGFW